MATRVINAEEMVYDGITYYRNEVFTLKGARNDDRLVSGHYVKVITGDMLEHETATDRDTGREFWTEGAMAAYKRNAPASDTILRIQRPIGRPAGAKDSKPRQPAAVKSTPEKASAS